MGRKPSNKDDQERNIETAISQIDSFLKDKKDDHLNFEESVRYKVQSGSLLLDYEMNGGIGPGLIRATGVSEGGKTSCGLAFARNFQQTVPNSMVVYIKSEGRLSESMIERSGIDTSPEKWFLFKCNVFETVIDLMKLLTKKNDENKRYMFIIDSMDALNRKADLEKATDESDKVGGGAVLTSTFLKKMALGLGERGHICYMISQVRAAVKVDPRQKLDHRLSNASGGNAIQHYADWILEFQPRYNADYISKTVKRGSETIEENIGHWCKVTFQKTPNEKSRKTVKYPIKYGRIDGKSVWIEYEIFDLLLAWGLIKKGGAWFSTTEELKAMLADCEVEMPEKIQGQDNVLNFLEQNEAATQCLAEKFKVLINEA